MRYFCAVWGCWMVRDWCLYRRVTIVFGRRKQYRRESWRKLV